jgi:hypothetical protein
MRAKYIAMFIVVLLFVGCRAEEIEEPVTQPEAEQIEEIEDSEPLCTPRWICMTDKSKAYRRADCAFERVRECEDVCEDGECKELIEWIRPEREEVILSEEEQIQQIFGYAKTKINSYSYRYKDPTGLQYNIYVKGNRMKIDYLPTDNDIYLNTENKTAEEWCIVYSRCGRETGKITDLKYDDVYIETPVDWLTKIKEVEKIDEGVYYGKQSWKMDTNIGEIIIDSNFGFIYSIKQEYKAYLFSDASFNTVKDSDVNVPEHLLS